MSREENKKKNLKTPKADKIQETDALALVLKILFVATPFLLSLFFIDCLQIYDSLLRDELGHEIL